MVLSHMRIWYTFLVRIKKKKRYFLQSWLSHGNSEQVGWWWKSIIFQFIYIQIHFKLRSKPNFNGFRIWKVLGFFCFVLFFVFLCLFVFVFLMYFCHMKVDHFTASNECGQYTICHSFTWIIFYHTQTHFLKSLACFLCTRFPGQVSPSVSRNQNF